MRMVNLSLNELKLVGKSRGIKSYKNMSKERLLSPLSESESIESKNSIDNERLRRIWEDFNEFRDRFSKPQIREIKKKISIT